ncbi:MAG: NAD(P)-dependent oxidoreductase [Anaerolineales bacterium]
MTKVMITGASGLLGANLVLSAMNTHDVIAVCHEHPIRLPNHVVVEADLSIEDNVRELFRKTSPDWVIHCAAATDVDRCQEDPGWAVLLNRDMAGYVAEAAREYHARLIHISTDAVFDGTNAPYAEEDLAGPINVYGKTKLEGERVVSEMNADAAIIRCNIFGWNARAKHNLAEWFIYRLERDEACPGFTDVLVSPILVNDLGDVLLQILDRGLSGIFHVGSKSCLSKYDFGVRLARVFGLDENLIQPVLSERAALKAPRPKDLCLKTQKIEGEINNRLPDVDECILAFHNLREIGYVERLKDLMRREP